MPKNEMIDLYGEVRKVLDYAIEFYDGSRTVFLPKSRIVFDENKTFQVIECEEWLAKERELV